MIEITPTAVLVLFLTNFFTLVVLIAAWMISIRDRKEILRRIEELEIKTEDL